MANETTFTISTNTNHFSINSPFSISYYIDETTVFDNWNGVLLPIFSLLNQDIMDNISKIYNLYNGEYNQINIELWDFNKSYSINSNVYVYDDNTEVYKSYKSIRKTNKLIHIDNTEYWTDYNTQHWFNSSNVPYSGDYETGYVEGTIVRVLVNQRDRFYRCINDTNNRPVSDTDYWEELHLTSWNYNTFYNTASMVYSDNRVYVSNKKVPIYSDLKDTYYWIPYYPDVFALEDINTELKNIIVGVDENLDGLFDEYNEQLILLKDNINQLENSLNSINDGDITEEEIFKIYENIPNYLKSIGIVHNNINKKYNSFKEYYLEIKNNEVEYDGNTVKIYEIDNIDIILFLLWRNMSVLSHYVSGMVSEDPIRILERIKIIDGFTDLLEEEKTDIVAFIKNKHREGAGHQNNGSYYIYNRGDGRWIEALLGYHEHPNKEILDKIGESLNSLDSKDNHIERSLVINRKSDDESMSWSYDVAWKDINFIPDKPNDGEEHILSADKDGNLKWTDNFSSSIAFVKKEILLSEDLTSIDFNIDMSYDVDGNILDTFILFENSMFVSNLSDQYDPISKILTIKKNQDSTVESNKIFHEGDHITLILVRNTSAEMLSKLSDNYVSKREAISLLSNGQIDLKDYVHKDTLNKYSLKNHTHTNYATKDHTHKGVYADYYHNHDGLYITRNELNELISGILEINPELVSIIAEIADDLETLENTFITSEKFNLFKQEMEEEIEKLKNSRDNALFIDRNGVISRISNVFIDEDEEVYIEYEPINIESNQIITKYKVSDDPEEEEFFNLEEYLDYLSVIVGSERQKIYESIYDVLKRDNYTKVNHFNSENEIYIDDFKINSLTLDIVEAFNEEIEIIIENTDGSGSFTLINKDDIIEYFTGVHTYDISYNVRVNSIIKVNRIANPNIEEEEGYAVISLSGYEI